MKVKRFETMVVGEMGFTMNTYVIENNNHYLVVDPGGDQTSVHKYLEGKTVDAILLTHGHFDHTGHLNEYLGLPVYVSKLEKELLLDDDYSCARMFMKKCDFTKVDFKYISEGELDLIGLKIKVIETPGHTKGSLCFLIENNLISGDTLFYNSVGRTDLFSGSSSDMKKSISKLMSMLSNNVNVYPGHDETGKLSEMKKVNPYLK